MKSLSNHIILVLRQSYLPYKNYCPILSYANPRLIRPHNGHDGIWSDYLDATCNGTFMKGVAIEILEKYKISCPSCSDSRGATNLKMICSDGEEFEGKTDDRRYLFITGNLLYMRSTSEFVMFGHEPNSCLQYFRGKWGTTMYCNDNMAICGVRVRMADSHTALNGAKFHCCPLPKEEDNTRSRE